jgi:nitrous oxidase accessory protein NosD
MRRGETHSLREQECVMKNMKIICSGALLSILSALPLHAQANPTTAPLLVDDDKVQCPTATFSTIQSAIDAASPGETIRVCAGTYHEQLTISKSVTLTADNGVTLSPVGMTANATGSTQSDQIAAAVLVKNTTSVLISGFRIDGSENAIIACSPRLIGVLIQDASARVEQNAVRHFRLNSSLPGCQSGNGIEVETSSGGESDATILYNSVDDYQKNGITANEAGSVVSIKQNFVAGIGPTTGAAQNGIQVGFGASGLVAFNTVSNNVWSPCVSVAECSTNATGVLIFSSDNVHVIENAIGTNQIGVFTNGANTLVAYNHIFNSLVLDGVAVAGNTNNIELNEITQSDQASVEIQGNDNSITSNKFLAAEFGILIDPGSTGTVHSANEFFATLTGVLDGSMSPAAAANHPASNSAGPKSAALKGNAGAKAAQRVSPSR